MLDDKLIIQHKEGDVTGDGINDDVYLVGVKRNADSPFIQDIEIVIEDGKTRIPHRISLKENAGYNPNIFLGPFTDKKVDDIFVSIESGGSGGFGFYYIYSFFNNKETSLFDTDEFNNTFKYTVTYQNDYAVEIINTTLRKSFIVDISMRDKQYLDDLYDKDGKLKKPIQGDVLFLNNLYPVDITGDGIYDLYAINRIIGLYGADTLGYIVTPLYWEKGAFTLLSDMQYIMIEGNDM